MRVVNASYNSCTKAERKIWKIEKLRSLLFEIREAAAQLVLRTASLKYETVSTTCGHVGMRRFQY
jgi:hypothetical protein